MPDVGLPGAVSALYRIELGRTVEQAMRSFGVTLAIVAGAWWLEGPEGETAAIALGALGVMYLFPLPMAVLRDRHDGNLERFAELPVAPRSVAWARMATVWTLTLPAALQVTGTLWLLELRELGAPSTAQGLIAVFGLGWLLVASVGVLLTGAMARWGMERLAFWPFVLWIGALLLIDRMNLEAPILEAAQPLLEPVLGAGTVVGLLGVTGLAAALAGGAHWLARSWLTSALHRCVPGARNE